MNLFRKWKVNRIAKRIACALGREMQTFSKEAVWVAQYGAVEVDPKHLVYWIVVESDREKLRCVQDATLLDRLRGCLDQYQYPAAARDEVHIGFESKETVNRVAGGDFRRYWQ